MTLTETQSILLQTPAAHTASLHSAQITTVADRRARQHTEEQIDGTGEAFSRGLSLTKIDRTIVSQPRRHCPKTVLALALLSDCEEKVDARPRESIGLLLHQC